MGQTAWSYTFFNRRIFKAIRKLYISLLEVENKLGCKDGKVKEYEYEHFTNRSKRIVQQFLQIFQS